MEKVAKVGKVVSESRDMKYEDTLQRVAGLKILSIKCEIAK